MFHRQVGGKSRRNRASKLKLARASERGTYLSSGDSVKLRSLVLAASRSISRSLLARNPLSCGLPSIPLLLLRTKTDERKEESEKNRRGKRDERGGKKEGGKRRKNREKAAAISIHSVLAYDFSRLSVQLVIRVHWKNPIIRAFSKSIYRKLSNIYIFDNSMPLSIFLISVFSFEEINNHRIYRRKWFSNENLRMKKMDSMETKEDQKTLFVSNLE